MVFDFSRQVFHFATDREKPQKAINTRSLASMVYRLELTDFAGNAWGGSALDYSKKTNFVFNLAVATTICVCAWLCQLCPRLSTLRSLAPPCAQFPFGCHLHLKFERVFSLFLLLRQNAFLHNVPVYVCVCVWVCVKALPKLVTNSPENFAAWPKKSNLGAEPSEHADHICKLRALLCHELSPIFQARCFDTRRPSPSSHYE